MSPDYLSRDNVLVVSFGEDPQNDTNAYQALTALKQLDSQDQIKIAGAAVVTRDPDDRVEVKSEVCERPLRRHRERQHHRPARRDHRRPARRAARRHVRHARRIALRHR